MATNVCRNSQCEYFNRPLPNNAKVCPLCGSALSNGGSASQISTSQAANTAQSSSANSPSAYQQIPLTPAGEPTTPPYTYGTAPSSPARPALKLLHTSRREFCLSGENGFIGRRGHTSNNIPEIDITGIPHEGIVSRSHARVYWDWSQNAYMIVDNNSRNGTYLNGTLLSRGVHYRLNYGDSLQLGLDNLVCFTVLIA